MNQIHPETLRDLAIRLAWGCLNIPYIYGGQNPLVGLDCSGLIVHIFRELGIFGKGEDYTAATLWETYRTKKVAYPSKGTLVFYKSYTSNEVGHVGICIDHDWCICASGGNENTKTLEVAQRRKARIRLKKIRYRKIWGYADPFSGN